MLRDIQADRVSLPERLPILSVLWAEDSEGANSTSRVELSYALDPQARFISAKKVPQAQIQKLERTIHDARVRDCFLDNPTKELLKVAGCVGVLYSSQVLREGVVTPSPALVEDLVSKIDDAIENLGEEGMLKTFSFEMLTPRLAHVNGLTRSLLAASFMRIQEAYESPKFAGTVFGRQEFAAWYRTQSSTKAFSYYLDWSGFNVPDYAVRLLHNPSLVNLTAGERALKTLLTPVMKEEKFYVIGSAGESDELDTRKTLDHEIRHGLFYTDAIYQKETLSIVRSLKLEPFYKWLASLGGYAEAVFEDEAQAYFGGDITDIENKSGLNLSDPSYREASRTIKLLQDDRINASRRSA